MTAQQVDAALSRFLQYHPKLIDLSLDRIFALLDKLGNPHHQLPPVIHIAGTNGKGSTLAFMRAMIEAVGLKAHCYTSPHLVRFNERCRIAGTLIDDATLAGHIETVEAVNGDNPITFFEITTAVVLLAFAQTKADITLLETGLGGRLDATNVIPKPLATVITPIALDHEHFLGNTIADIAREKAGIMRKGVPVFSAQQEQAAASMLQSESSRLGAMLHTAGVDFSITPQNRGISVTTATHEIAIPEIGLRGKHQQENAGLAAAVLTDVLPAISETAIRQGAAGVRWPARGQELIDGKLKDAAGDVRIWLDGAHNAHGADALAANLRTISKSASESPSEAASESPPWVLICGALNTRSPMEFLHPLKPLISHAITLAIPDNGASLSADALAQAAHDMGIDAQPCDTLIVAIAIATGIARENQGNIIISGSLYLAGHALKVNGTLPD